MNKRQLRRIIRRVINESSGTKGPYDSFGDVVGGRHSSRGRMVPTGGSEIHPNAQEAWEFICDMDAPHVPPSFWEDGKLASRFGLGELEDLLDSLLEMDGPAFAEWTVGEPAADAFIARLEEEIQLLQQIG